MKLKDLLSEAIFWGGSHAKAFTNENDGMNSVDIRKTHDVQTEAKFDSKDFIKAVKDEFDVETLEMMKMVIDKQIRLVNKMGDLANPRKTVKGFKK
jgi:hypothetical protein